MAYATAAARQLERVCDDEAMRLADAGLSVEPLARTRGLLLEVRAEAHRRRGRLAEARADLKAALESLRRCVRPLPCPGRAGHPGGQIRHARRGEELVELAIAEARGQPDALGQALAAAAIIDLATGNLARAEHRSRQAQTAAGAGWGQPRKLPGCCTGARW